MTERVLFVDDDANILAGYRRQLRKRFDLHTAEGGAEGLELLKQKGPFAVAVSDMNMPEMDGLQFLKQVGERSPDCVRIMLTGNADQKTAVDAVNESGIFRFCNKPCPPEVMAETIESGLRHYRLITAERELLERTLAGSVKVLLDVLALVDPDSFGATARLRDWTRRMVAELKLAQGWEFDLAAMLSPVGGLTLPAEIKAKLAKGEALSAAEKEVLSQVPVTARDLIANIPRLGGVADYLYHQGKGFDGSGFPNDGVAGKELPLGARLLRLLVDLAAVSNGAMPDARAFVELEARKALYDPELLAAARRCLVGESEAAAEEPRAIKLAQLKPGDRLVSDITTVEGQLVLADGQEVSAVLIQKLRNLHKLRGIKEPILVLPAASETPGDGTKPSVAA